MRRMCLALVALLFVSCVASAATTPVHFGLFGDVHTATPAGEIKRAVVLVSDKSGWNARDDALADALASDGALVLGVDLPAYLKQMLSINDKCSFPAAHFEEMVHWMQREQKLDKFIYPLLIGDGTGATFAYAVAAQAPAGTYAGLITLGWDASLRLPKPICHGDAGNMTAADANGFRVVPVRKLANVWLPQPFAPGAHRVGLLDQLPERMKVWMTPAEKDAGVALVDAVRWLTTHVESAAPPLPSGVADLPLVEVPAQGEFAQRYAVILTGDGGWAGLDIAIADQLAKRGIAVVGLNTLKFFWQTRKPTEAADALTRIIGHYGGQHPQADFIVLGYSFGAALSPVVVNRVPDAARARITAQVLISPDPEAVFEIHVGDWFGSTKHEGAIPILPEISKTKVPVICVHGDEEDDSFCKSLTGRANVRELVLPGGHHYNGDYDKLGAGIAAALPLRR